MGLYSYSLKVDDEKKAARAQMHDVNASYKDLSQVLRAIRKKPVAEATRILEDVISKKKPIPYRKFSKHLAHRPQLGGKKGRYPIKEAKIALKLLKNAIANANSKGLDAVYLFVQGAAAYKQNVLMRYRRYWAGSIVIGYGRQSYASKYTTCWAELTLIEREKPEKKKQEAKKQEKTPPAKAEPVEKPIENKVIDSGE